MAISITILKMDNIKNLDDAAQKLLQGANLDVRPHKVEWPTDDILHRRWRGALGVNEITSGTNEKFKYIFVNALVERPRRKVKDENNKFLDRVDRVNTVTSDALFFEHGNSVYCAVYMTPGTKVNTVIKELLKEEIWGSITHLPTDYHILDDTYYWILSKFLSGGKNISGNPKMTIEAFTGYTGTTADNAHSMSGEGERISAMLGTLAFIFGNDQLKSLKLNVTYKDEYLFFDLGNKGNVQIFENDYDGRFCVGGPEKEKVLITLLLYKIVIPRILECYQNTIDSGEWSTAKRTEFIRGTGNEIIDRVQKELDELELKV